MPSPEITDNPERYERGKISLIRTDRGKAWWRITVYVGDSTEDLDRATDEALRIDARLHSETPR